MIKCAECGKFISHKEIDEGKTSFHFVPDSWYSKEEIEHAHKNCDMVPCL